MSARLDWALHAGAGFWVGFGAGLTALIAWLAWMASEEERASHEGWPYPPDEGD